MFLSFKKSFAYFSVSLLILLCACQNSKLEDDIRMAGEDSVRIADDFLNEEISGTQACDKIDMLSEMLPPIEGDKTADLNADVTTAVIKLSMAFESLPESGRDERDTVLDARNTLAKLLKIKMRSSDYVPIKDASGASDEEENISEAQ